MDTDQIYYTFIIIIPNHFEYTAHCINPIIPTSSLPTFIIS